MPSAAIFTKPIEIWRVTHTIDEYGENVDTYECAYKTRCGIRQLRGARGLENDETLFQFSKEFILRLYVPVNDFDRLKFEGDFYTITNIERNEQLQQITISASKINE